MLVQYLINGYVKSVTHYSLFFQTFSVYRRARHLWLKRTYTRLWIWSSGLWLTSPIMKYAYVNIMWSAFTREWIWHGNKKHFPKKTIAYVRGFITITVSIDRHKTIKMTVCFSKRFFVCLRKTYYSFWKCSQIARLIACDR